MTAEEIVVLIVLIIIIALGAYLYGLKSGKQEGKDELIKDLVLIWRMMLNFSDIEDEKEKCNDKSRTEASTRSSDEGIREGV